MPGAAPAQERLLTDWRASGSALRIFLRNKAVLSGRLVAWDAHTLLIRTDAADLQLLQKKAVLAVVPPGGATVTRVRSAQSDR